MIIFIYVCCMIIPILIFVFGIISYVFTPKKINSVFGFRTELSMKNDETWIFAHKYCGKLWIVLGIGMILVSAIVSMILRLQTENIKGVGIILLVMIQTLVLLFSIIPTQRAMKKIFDPEGNRI